MKENKASIKLLLTFLTVFTIINLMGSRIVDLTVHGKVIEIPMLNFFIGTVLLGYLVSLIDNYIKRKES